MVFDMEHPTSSRSSNCPGEDANISQESNQSTDAVHTLAIRTRKLYSSWRMSVKMLFLVLLLLSVGCQTPDCPNMPNTDGQPSSDGSTCSCITVSSTFWDAPSNNCLVDCQVIKNSDGLEPLIDCTCNNLYTWVQLPIPLCTANCATDLYASCTDYNINGQCDCITNFVFDSPTAKCTIDCSAVPRAGQIVAGTIDQCTCLPSPTFVWNPTTRLCDLSCSAVANVVNTTIDPVSHHCYCLPKYIWNDIGSSCDLNCNDISNTVFPSINNNSTFCECSPNYVWNGTLLTCILSVNCTAVTHSNGSNTDGTCNCTNPYSFILGNPSACNVNCSLIANTTTVGTIAAGANCSCNAPQIWNITTLTCNLSCNATFAANGTIDLWTCSCINHYVWTPDNLTCSINCTGVLGGSGTVVSQTECRCLPGHIWNGTSFTCEINCNGILYAIAPTNPTLSQNGICNCVANFYFNPYIPQCVINCSLFSGSFGINLSPETCKCKPKYVWTVSPTFSCKLDCVSVANSNGAQSVDNVNCVCNPGFRWFVGTAECRRDCTLDPLSIGVLATATKCQCRSGATWNTILLRCVVSCVSIPNTDGTAATANNCVCSAGFNWDLPTLSCIYRC